MKHSRFTYLVSLERDDIPGFNHQPEDMQKTLERFLERLGGHYNPKVEFVAERDSEGQMVLRNERGYKTYNEFTHHFSGKVSLVVGDVADCGFVASESWLNGVKTSGDFCPICIGLINEPNTV